MSLVAAAIILAAAIQSAPWCGEFKITGYVRTEGNMRTYDGTLVTSEEPFAAAGWDIPINSMVVIDGLGVFRVADRGRLGPMHLDIPTWTRAEAYQLTGVRQACVFPPEF